MMQAKRRLLRAVLTATFLLMGGGVFAQIAAVIVYAEGESLAVVSSGGRQTILDVADALGRELSIGDTVATEQGTFVELQLLPSDNLVKIAENTNFTIEERTTARGGVFSLVYGKVRARVTSLTLQEEFTIRSRSASAGVRGTDFGVSVVIPGLEEEEGVPTPELLEETPAVTQVYCFDGQVEVEVAPAADTPPQTPPTTVTVRENQVVTLAAAATEAPAPEAIPQEIRTYWQVNDFKAEPLPAATQPGVGVALKTPPPTVQSPEKVRPAPQVEPRVETQPQAAPQTEPQPTPQEAPQAAPQAEPAPELVTPVEEVIRRTSVNRVRFRAISLLLFGVGAAVEAAGIVDLLSPDVNLFGESSAGIMGVGVVFLAGGVFSMFQVARLGQQIQDLEQTGAP